MTTLCSQCRTTVVEETISPYREAQMLDKPLASPIKMPWLTPERKATAKRSALLFGFSVVASIMLSAGIIFLPQVMVTIAAGLGVVAAGIVTWFVGFVAPHKLGVAIARKRRWHRWFICNDLTEGYDFGDCGPVAWLLGAGIIGALPGLYGLGCLCIYLLNK